VRIAEIFFDNKICNLFSKHLHVAVGTFDGVHIGHRKLISAAVDSARESAATAAVYTFYPHPTVVTDGENAKPALCSRAEKYARLRDCGIDCIVEQRFDGRFANATPDEFMEFMGHKFPTLCEVFVGEDFRFGHNRSANADALRDGFQKFGVAVTIVAPVTLDGERVSSSRIRQLIGQGNHSMAQLMLGRR
jgi:riboflavin kinase/FMN adenylyltransferase